MVTIGDGRAAVFWHSSWLGAGTPAQAYPELFRHSRRKNRSVQQALHDDTWIKDLAHGNVQHLLPAFLHMQRQIRDAATTLQGNTSDSIRWNHDPKGEYTASSAYDLQFQGRNVSDFDHNIIWKTWAPGKIKMFAWLLLQNRLWCNDRLQRRGWPNSYFCQLCVRNLETVQHLFWTCPVALEVWNRLAHWGGCRRLAPREEWYRQQPLEIVRKIIHDTEPAHRKGAKTMLLLGSWELWQERNKCTFRKKLPSALDVIREIRNSIDLWRLAGAQCLESPFGDPP